MEYKDQIDIKSLIAKYQFISNNLFEINCSNELHIAFHQRKKVDAIAYKSSQSLIYFSESMRNLPFWSNSHLWSANVYSYKPDCNYPLYE